MRLVLVSILYEMKDPAISLPDELGEWKAGMIDPYILLETGAAISIRDMTDGVKFLSCTTMPEAAKALGMETFDNA